MSTPKQPLVSVVTPVRNGATYLPECIASVLAQTYQHFEYFIVDNCSDDGTAEVAEACARRDPRVRTVRHASFVSLAENHNRAFRLISPRSMYCKVVSADDWVYPECIAKLVEAAERYPTAGIVGSYAVNDLGVRWLGLSHDTSLFDGRDVARRYLLGLIDFCGTPSAVLYRSALVRSTDDFFPGTSPNADVATFLTCLEVSDFALVHQILGFERLHEGAVSTPLKRYNAFLVDRLEFLHRFGSRFLTTEEFAERRETLLTIYYRALATARINRRESDFWRYHAERLRGMGLRLEGARLARAIVAKLADLLLNPKQTTGKLMKRLSHSSAAVGGTDWA